MSRINLGRVVIGGLLAGLIINIGEFILNGVLHRRTDDCCDGRAQQAAGQPEHDHVVRAVRVRSGLHAGLDVRGYPPAIRRRRQDRDLCVDARVGTFLSLPESLHDHHPTFSRET